MPQVMTNDDNCVERVALEMIDQFGASAAYIALKLAEASDEVQDDLLPSAETWREIANVIERQLTNDARIQKSSA